MAFQLRNSYLISYSKLRFPPLGRLALQLDTLLFFILLLRCIMRGHANATMNRMSVSSQECWQYVEVSRCVVSPEILPHTSLHRLVESFYHDCFSLDMCTIHFDAFLFQIFLERSIVKFRTLINPELGWFLPLPVMM